MREPDLWSTVAALGHSTISEEVLVTPGGSCGPAVAVGAMAEKSEQKRDGEEFTHIISVRYATKA